MARIMITGHTGLKGSWMGLFLAEMGMAVAGYSDNPHELGHYKMASLSRIFEKESWADIKDFSKLSRAIKDFQPDIIFHFAAQSLVPKAHARPKITFDDNLGGTWNMLRAFSESESASHLIVATTDKVYGSSLSAEGYCETAVLQGTEPYSQSKVLADQLAQQYPTPVGKKISIVRAGNVVGGGDHNLSRLIPEIVQNAASGVLLRQPESRRPWQHVLDVSAGYLLIAFRPEPTTGIYNLGPDEKKGLTAEEVAHIGFDVLDLEHNFLSAGQSHSFDETNDLRLDSGAIRRDLGWKPKFTQKKSIEMAFEWHKLIAQGAPAQEVSIGQVQSYLENF